MIGDEDHWEPGVDFECLSDQIGASQRGDGEIGHHEYYVLSVFLVVLQRFHGIVKRRVRHRRTLLQVSRIISLIISSSSTTSTIRFVIASGDGHAQS